MFQTLSREDGGDSEKIHKYLCEIFVNTTSTLTKSQEYNRQRGRQQPQLFRTHISKKLRERAKRGDGERYSFFFTKKKKEPKKKRKMAKQRKKTKTKDTKNEILRNCYAISAKFILLYNFFVVKMFFLLSGVGF